MTEDLRGRVYEGSGPSFGIIQEGHLKGEPYVTHEEHLRHYFPLKLKEAYELAKELVELYEGRDDGGSEGSSA